MKALRWMFVTVFAVTFLFVGLDVSLNPSDARAEIKELKIGIGVDADTLNPQEQTTTLFQNMCDLIYGNFF
ncbi:MAG: hypothetical protein JRJ82_21190, partial [Deltaproteobacteria bacterium]|nr:hypothetical protein [Deltaproteobacteria bacterium]